MNTRLFRLFLILWAWYSPLCAHAQDATGLLGAYYPNKTFTEPASLRRTDADIAFDWGAGSPPSVPADNFSVRWIGQIVAPASGLFTFRLRHDDYGVLTINNQVIVNTPNTGPADSYGTMQMVAGTKYTFECSYVELTKTAKCSVWWMLPGTTKYVTVPASAYLQPVPISPPQPNPPGGAMQVTVAVGLDPIFINGSRTDKVHWNPVKVASAYTVYQKGENKPIGRVLAPATSFTVPVGVYYDQAEYYVVVEEDVDPMMAIKSIPSNSVITIDSKKSGSADVPKVPKNVKVSAYWEDRTGQIGDAGQAPVNEVSWTGNDYSYYKVYRDGSLVAWGLSIHYYVDTDVAPGQSYTYQVSSTTTPVVNGPIPESAKTAPVTGTALSAAPASVKISGVSVTMNDDSFIVSFPPVAGAVAYSCQVEQKPQIVKYSLSPRIEMNGYPPDQKFTVIVKAYCCPAPTMFFDGVPGPGNVPGSTLVHINGLGDPYYLPYAFGVSDPVAVGAGTANPFKPVVLAGTQVFFDNFRGSQPFVQQQVVNAQIAKATGGDPPDGTNRNYRVLTNGKWSASLYGADNTNTAIFIMSNHLMDSVYDGGSPHSNVAPHNNNTSIAFQPINPDGSFVSWDISGGRVIHATMEVDPHNGGRRWCDIQFFRKGEDLLRPAVSKTQGTNGLVTTSGDMFLLQVDSTAINPLQYRVENGLSAYHELGQTDNAKPGFEVWSRSKTANGFLNGDQSALDLRSKFDVYLSATKFMIVESQPGFAPRVVRGNLLFLLPFEQIQIAFVHEVYHTMAEHAEIINYSPNETYWQDMTPFRDERHWDQMGVEVLSAFPAL